jgi:hypothetical protein
MFLHVFTGTCFYRHMFLQAHVFTGTCFYRHMFLHSGLKENDDEPKKAPTEVGAFENNGGD